MSDYKAERKTILNPDKQIIRFSCCDCGLVHDIKFKTKNDSPITVIMTRNGRATGQIRRWRRVKSKERLN